jgi:hypothetical protein
MIFFVSTLVLALLIYNFIFKFFFDWRASKFNIWYHNIMITGGLFIVNYIAFKGLAELQKTDYSIWYPLGITLLMFWMRGLLIVFLNPTAQFYSTKEDKPLGPFPEIHYKKVKEFDSDWIGIYPRITIRDVELESDWKNPKHIIFDSSDFIVINKTFGAFDNLQESFSQGKKIKFKNTELLTERVQVDFMNIYDDYSGGLISKHTDAYEGKDTPYNIQIIVFARRIEK